MAVLSTAVAYQRQGRKARVPVEYVYPHYTSKTCHACRHLGYRPHQGTFKCTNEARWVSECQADLNTAGNIANMPNPW
jgi:putative transposase